MTRMLHAPGHAGRGTTCRRLPPTRKCSDPDPAGLGRRSTTLQTVQEWRAGRCGVLTRILVGAVRTCRSRRAGPAPRIPPADPERTARSYDAAAASSSRRFPALCSARGYRVRFARVTYFKRTISQCGIFHRCVCPLRHDFSAMLLHALQHPCPTSCSFCSDSCRRQVSLSAGHSPAGPAGRPPSESARTRDAARGPDPAP